MGRAEEISISAGWILLLLELPKRRVRRNIRIGFLCLFLLLLAFWGGRDVQSDPRPIGLPLAQPILFGENCNKRYPHR